MNLNGDLVISPQFDEGSYFFEGYATVKIGEFWSFISPDGTLGERFDFGWVGTLSEGYAAVQTAKDATYIDKTGKLAFGERYFWRTHSFRDGLEIVYDKSLFGVVDTKGNYVIESKQLWLSPQFSEGFCRVQLEGDGWFPFNDDKHGYIDKTGKTVINGRFSHVTNFHEGAAFMIVGNSIIAGGFRLDIDAEW